MALPAEQLRYSFADALDWGEDEYYEIIDGDIYMMSSPLTVHQRISRKLMLQIGGYLEGKRCEVFAAPFDVRPFEKEGDAPEDVDTVLIPDITVVCDSAKLDKYGCRGAPDMVIEILSPSSRVHDMKTKYRIYQRAGVREYWIVDPEIKIVNVFLLEDGQYNAPASYTAKARAPVSLWEGFSVDLSLVFGEYTHERNKLQ